ncbi:MAG: DNA methylase, partial [Clostridia bacterium]|nr:DNA methylase [Clostridia bacterium]
EYPIQDIYPINELPEGFNTGQPKQSKNIYWVHQFFTKRNLIAISHLYRIIGESQMSMQFRFLFTGLLLRSTKMNRVHINNYFFGGGGWNAGFLKGTLYIPNSPIETSVLSQIQDKVAAILRAAQFLPKSYGNVQYVGSASKLNISDNSIDYIFTDPPFGSNINYSELNFLPEAWLRVTTDNATEAIDNVAQGKDKDFYRREMQICFAEYYRVLKPDKWITIEFSNTNAGIWNSIQQALTKAGFIIANVAALNKGQGGIRSITSTTAVKQDLAISCYKPSIIITDTARLSCDNNLWKFVEEHLNHLAPYIINNGKLEEVRERDARIIYDRLISYFVQKGISVPVNAQEFQQGLRERFIERDGMFFTISQAMEYDEKKRQGIEFVPMGIIIGCEADGIAWLRNRLERKPQTYQELQPEWLHDLVSTKKGDSMPEMMQILDENFLKNDKDQWYVPDVNNQTDLEAMRTKKLLREFSLYVEAKKVKTARLEALKAGFKNCYQNKDFATIIAVGNKIPESLLMEDETLLQYYDIASSRVS